MWEKDCEQEAQAIANAFIRNIRIAQAALTALVIIVGGYILFAPYLDSDEGFLIGYLIIVVTGVACILFVRIFVIRQFARLLKIIDTECDPEKFTAVFQSLKPRRLMRKRALSMDLNIAHGLCMSGRFQQAYDILQEIDIRIKPPIFALQYYSTLANCGEALGFFWIVENAKVQVEEIKNKLKPASKISKRADRALSIIEVILAEHDGQYDAAFDMVQQFLHDAQYPIQKVSASGRLARLYFIKHDYENAKIMCEYVISNGNKLIHVQKAKNLLAEM